MTEAAAVARGLAGGRRDLASARGRARSKLGLALVGVALVSAACGSSPAQVSPAQADNAIGHAFSTLFDFSNHSVTAKTAVVQDGSTLHTAISEALASSLAKQAAGAKVSAVRLLSKTSCTQAVLPSPCAKVTYNLLGPSGTPLFATPSIGYAVEVSGHWLVAKSTICGLLDLFYSVSGHHGQPPGC
ncbi:MAG: hypothetical protein M0010_21605 [Actinomycetota bacterium]|nr:hypothetical protein [Actinomycetota bacterium]